MKGLPLLVEIGMEECPARFLDQAMADLQSLFEEALRSARIDFSGVRTYATPRRLAATVADVALRQRDLEEEVKGPPARVAFDADGKPTKAALGFAANQGVSVDALVTRETPVGAYVYAVKKEPGRQAAEVLSEIVPHVVRSLKFPKSMRWTEDGIRFARPLRWLVVLLGEEVVPCEVSGVRSGRESQGHRFLCGKAVTFSSATEYVQALRERGFVIVDPEERRSIIREQAKRLGEACGGVVTIDDELLGEVSHLVEYPTALLGSFDPGYLKVPPEILVTSMKEHQKFFPVRGADGSLLPHFVAVRNGNEEHIDVVRAGNERVLSARLADAKFFFDEDRKRPLAERVEELNSVLFQEQLGSVREKAERMRACIKAVGGAFDAEDVRLADRAALLAKADLVTQVVYEFPELQGVMGRVYALESGEDPRVAEAIYDHYLPRFAGDELPRRDPGVLVALADKIDTIVGCFGIGLIPTGSADPYALRRQALGIIRILLSRRPALTLDGLTDASLAAYGKRLEAPEATRAAVLDFFSGRVAALWVEQGYRHDLVDAALAPGVGDVVAAEARLKALSEAARTSLLEEVRSTQERCANLARKAESTHVDAGLFEHAEEKALWSAIESLAPAVASLCRQGAFGEAIERLRALKGPVDAFFDTVLVMAEDPRVRANRLALLARARDLFACVADWSRIVEKR